MAATVLVADTSASARLALRNLIQTRHPELSVYEALDGVEAIEKAQALQPDLVILDLTLPRVNGLEAAAAIKKVLPATQIISVTVFPEILGRAMCAAIGPDIVLSEVKLLEELDALLASTAENSSQPAQKTTPSDTDQGTQVPKKARAATSD